MPAAAMRNSKAIDLHEIPIVSLFEFRGTVLGLVDSGARVAALFGFKLDNESVRLVAVLAHGGHGALSVLCTDLKNGYPALTPDCPQVHWFEREIAEQTGLEPIGHPWLKPVRFHSCFTSDKADVLPGVTQFFQVDGSEIHEVAVGPVHAGIIEPGHFRFQCHGEKVLHLEIALGYQHRGVEKALIGGPNKRTIHYMETLAGDTSVAHATAYCEVLEALAECSVPARAQTLRGVALELERLANHVGDLGALAGDVAYLPTASYCGRIRGDFLNLTALLCGNRFGRGMIQPGGAGFDLDQRQISELLERLQKALADVRGAINLLWESPSVQARFEETGMVSPQMCRQLGLVGVASRACGLERDARQEFPSGIYRFFQIPVCTWHTGDVFARGYVRALEVSRSAAFIKDQFGTIADGEIRAGLSPLAADRMTVTLVEGWRGEVCHVAITDSEGRFRHYKVVDPSFHNWMGLAVAMRGQQISDFPLCNKSFNLSYCGHDL